jgi:2-dehydropantoate 2-reductase
MQFTIVGAGALGTILAAHLIAAGHEVTLVARGLRAAQLEREGLRLRGLREFDLPCTVVQPGAAIDPAGVVIYTVKTYQMDEALASLAHLAPSAVFSVANGVMKNEQLAAVYGASRVLGCMANVSGELLATGEVLFTRNVRMPLGALPGYRGPDPRAIAAAIAAAGVITPAVDDIETAEWSKFAGWLAMFTLAVIARTTTGVYLENPGLAAVGVKLVREAVALARARGITLIDQSPIPVLAVADAATPAAAVEILRDIGRNLISQAPTHRMSALQDFEAGRRLEVHETLGYAQREAARLGVAAPTIAFCYELVAGLDTLPRGA